MNKLTASPSEFDTALADLYLSLYTARTRLDHAWANVHHAAGDRQEYRTGWRMTNEQARVKVVEIKNNSAAGYTKDAAANVLRGLGERRMEVADILEEIAEYDSVFSARGGWSRIFLVTNGNGHAHSSMDCHTCFPTTQFHWVTELSGHSEEEIVNAAADRACTVCFPTAPVNKKSTLRTPDEIDKEKAREEKAAAKAAKDKKARENAPTKDGSPLRVNTGNRYDEVFKTERAAVIWATDQMAWGNTTGVQEVVDAIAEKRGVPAMNVWDEFEKKAAKKAGK